MTTVFVTSIGFTHTIRRAISEETGIRSHRPHGMKSMKTVGITTPG